MSGERPLVLNNEADGRQIASTVNLVVRKMLPAGSTVLYLGSTAPKGWVAVTIASYSPPAGYIWITEA